MHRESNVFIFVTDMNDIGISYHIHCFNISIELVKLDLLKL